MNDSLGRKEDGSKGDDEYEAGHDSVAITVSFRHIAVDEQTDDLSHIGSITETGLPGSRNLIIYRITAGNQIAVFFFELREAIEISN